MAGFELAHINVARFRRPVEDPANADFLAMLERVNATADRAPGFVWRLEDALADPADLLAFGDPRVLVNVSVWRDVESLREFTYGTALHREMMRRRGAWFERMEVSLGLWWVPMGHRPGVAEGKGKLEILRGRGACGEVFTFSDVREAPV
jgi:heme-degrading monooxygenase HmoA